MLHLFEYQRLGASILAKGVTTPSPAFPFLWDDTCWRHAMEYCVNDFEAELGFFAGVLGFSINTISSDYVMFTPPSREFFFSVSRAVSEKPTAGLSGLKCCFMMSNIETVHNELLARGVEFSSALIPVGAGLNKVLTRSPNGMEIELWGSLSGR